MITTASMANGDNDHHTSGLMPYGKNRRDGGHDHRYNRGLDRTPAQRRADTNKAK